MRIVRLQYRVDVLVIHADGTTSEYTYTSNDRGGAEQVVHSWESNFSGAVATITEEEVP